MRSPRIAIVRALPGLGDLLCAVPAWRALRTALPHAHIAVIGMACTAPMMDRFRHYVDELVPLPGFPGLSDQPPNVHHLPAFLRDVHARRFDLALQMHGSGSVTNILLELLGAHVHAGFYPPHAACPDPAYFFLYPEHEHEVHVQLKLIKWLGAPSQGEQLEFPLCAADRLVLDQMEEARALQSGAYVCIHAGASTPLRRWPPQRFAAVADALAAQGLQIVLTGSIAERSLAETVAAAMDAPAINLAGRTDLGALAALLAGARLVVCNDTGVSHVAAALPVPSVVIFTTDGAARWAPLNRERHRALYDPEGVPVAAVLHEAHDLLRREAAGMLYAQAAG